VEVESGEPTLEDVFLAVVADPARCAMTRPMRFLVRVGAMASKEVMHIRRDPRTLYIGAGHAGSHAAQSSVLASSFDMDRIPLVVLRRRSQRASRALVRAVSRGPRVRHRGRQR